jgi:hypothetical protein
VCNIGFLSVRAVIKVPQPILPLSRALREWLEVISCHINEVHGRSYLPPVLHQRAHVWAVIHKINRSISLRYNHDHSPALLVPGRGDQRQSWYCGRLSEGVIIRNTIAPILDADIPSDRLEARSKKPTAGLVTALIECECKAIHRSVEYTTHPTKPFPTPLKKPSAPSDSAPSIGFIYHEVALSWGCRVTMAKSSQLRLPYH